MAKKTPQLDPEEAQAERHVQELMGPPQAPGVESLDVPPTLEPVSPQVSVPETEPSESTLQAKIVPEVATEKSMPEESIAAEPTETAVDTPQPDTTEVMSPGEVVAEEVPEDPATDAAVDDIVHSDSDAALPEATDDAAVVMKSSPWERFRNGWLNWWANPRKRYGTLAVLAVLLVVLFFVAPVRAAVLNVVGVRSSLTVDVLDGATNLPLENAVVSADGKTVKTNADGHATLKDIHLGNQEVRISKVAFAAYTKEVSFGLRIVDLGEVTLKPTGAQLSYTFTDYLSGKPVSGVQLTSGEATAKSDSKGRAVITIQPSSTDDATIRIKKDGYRTENLSTPSDVTTTIRRRLVPANPAVFVSKESGKYDVYKMYIDGKDRKVLLPGTGLETQAIVALPSPDGTRVAVASTRDDKRNHDGYLLTALTMVDTKTADTTNIEYAENITLIGWQGDTLVYVQTVAGTSAANPNRQKIIAYDFGANKRFQLASANYFTSEQLIGGSLCYTVSSTDPAAKATFVKINIDGTSKKTLFGTAIWSLIRTDYDAMKFQTPDKWYEYTVGATAPITSTPANDYASRFYVDSPDGKASAWVDVRDNKGVLTKYSLGDGKETELTSQKNMQSVVYWLNKTDVVYRIAGATEVADYVMSVNGGQPQKISDVTLSGIR